MNIIICATIIALILCGCSKTSVEGNGNADALEQSQVKRQHQTENTSSAINLDTSKATEVRKSFDPTAKRISTELISDDPQTILNLATKILLGKSEFETTDKYNERYRIFSKSMLEELDLNRLLVFEIKPYLIYDADKEIFSYDARCTKSGCTIYSENDDSAKYSSINSAVSSQYGFLPYKISWTKVISLSMPNAKQDTLATKGSLHMKSEEAAKVKNSITTVVFGRLIEPFQDANRIIYPSPTNEFRGANWNKIFFEFEGIWLVNRGTGEIIKKLKI